MSIAVLLGTSGIQSCDLTTRLLNRFWRSVCLCRLGCSGSHCAGQEGLELAAILLPQSPESNDYRCAMLYPACLVHFPLFHADWKVPCFLTLMRSKCVALPGEREMMSFHRRWGTNDRRMKQFHLNLVWWTSELISAIYGAHWWPRDSYITERLTSACAITHESCLHPWRSLQAMPPAPFIFPAFLLVLITYHYGVGILNLVTFLTPSLVNFIRFLGLGNLPPDSRGKYFSWEELTIEV